MTLTGLIIKGRCVELKASISLEQGWGTEEEIEVVEDVKIVVEVLVEAVEAVEAVEVVEVVEVVRELETARNGLKDPATYPGTRVDTGLGIRSLALLYIF